MIQQPALYEKKHAFMIIVCPSCSSRYLVSDSSIGENGRDVRCASCNHQWFQEGIGAGSQREDSFGEEPEQDFLRQYEDEIPDLGFDPIPESVKPQPEDFADLVLQHGGQGDTAPEKPTKPKKEKNERKTDRKNATLAFGGRRAALTGYASAAALFIVLTIGMGALKDTMVRAWPASALIYETFGAKVRIPGEGLIFDRVVAAVEKTEGGKYGMTVTGTILNLTQSDVPIPPVVATLLSEKGEKLTVFPITTEGQRLKPEQSVPFTLETSLEKKEAKEVNLAFLARTPKEKQEKATPTSLPPSPHTQESIDH